MKSKKFERETSKSRADEPQGGQSDVIAHDSRKNDKSRNMQSFGLLVAVPSQFARELRGTVRKVVARGEKCEKVSAHLGDHRKVSWRASLSCYCCCCYYLNQYLPLLTNIKHNEPLLTMDNNQPAIVAVLINNKA